MLTGKSQGVLLIVLGALFMTQSLELKWGSLTNLGPGFWPSVLSATLIVLGVFMVFLVTQRQHNETLKPLSVITVLLSMLVYAILVTKVGLVITGLAVLGISMLARYSSVRFIDVVHTAVLLFFIIGFLRLIGIDTPLWPVI
jgi:putative tricarboxylic transport membrane protein